MLSDKLIELRKLNLVGITVEEISVATQRHGGRVSFTTLRSLFSGGASNPSRKKLVALARTFKTPVRYLADDRIKTPIDAVLAEARLLGQSEFEQFVERLKAGN